MKRTLRPQPAPSHDLHLQTPSTPSQPKVALACVRCASRKVKCDRNQPCGACIKHGQDCVFQAPKRSRRKRRMSTEEELLRRLGRFEALLNAEGRQEDAPSNRQNTDNAFQRPPERPLSPRQQSSSINTPRVILDQGQSLFINNGLWSRVVEEFQHPADVLQDSPRVDAGFVFSMPTSAPSHPSETQRNDLWAVFVDNVDPLTKAVHVPTLEHVFLQASGNLDVVPRRFEALMFAIYSAGALSLSDADCQSRLGESRDNMRRKFVLATQAALSRANFIATRSLIVLQALILHIISANDLYEPRAVWTLTGIAVRLASGMGLDRDGQLLGLSPFDTEIRRRVWWLISALDIRSAELCGLPKFRGMELSPDAPKRPANVNDANICPDMSAIPQDSESMTDAIFVALRYELLGFAGTRVSHFRQLGKDSSKWDQELASDANGVEEIEAQLETKYLRRCDPSQPLQLMSMLMARSAIDTIRFLTHHPRRWATIDQAPPAERQFLWEVCVRLIEQRNMLQSTPLLRRFAWQAPFVIQWSAFIHLLDCLLVSPQCSQADRAWMLIGETFRNNPELLQDWTKPLHRAVGSLCVRAYDARSSEEVTPDFVDELRRRRNLLTTSQAPGLDPPNKFDNSSDVEGDATKTDCELVDLINSLESAAGAEYAFALDQGDLPFYTGGPYSFSWEQWDSLLGIPQTQ